ncbi:PASTA domain-containing protein [Streptomyces sp. NPDC090075]|uniref:PASTA domain-containing protein n=1 Tax=Streptomyces sp. NPDC090075 TaxID=3365937 RepID=UPI003809D3D1
MTFGGPHDPTFSPPVRAAVLGGRYELRRLLGSGGMTQVYLAHDLRLDRPVAVKTLRADLVHDPLLQERFRGEARSTASLNHPAVAAVYDTGEHPVHGVGLPYLVTEYVDGTTLREALYTEPPPSVGHALEITAGVLRALAHAHHCGIAHGDIRPANVMLTSAGRVKVRDFGTARYDVDAGSDLYATGCLLYELLTLCPPFTGDPATAETDRSKADAIVLRALTEDQEFRYRSAQEMLADVEACLGAPPVAAVGPHEEGGEGGEGEEGEEGERAAGGRRGGTVALAVAGAGVVTLGLVLGWYMFGRGTADDGRTDVPDLVGQTLAQARSTAGNVGLTVTVADREPCADQPRGRVCEQSPGDGELAKGAAVSVTVSTGAPKKRAPGSTATATAAEEAAKATVPDLTGATLSEARSLLAGAELELGRTTEVESGAEAGTVIGQSAASGTGVAPGTSVDVEVAEAVRTVRIPDDLGGATLAEARDELGTLGLRLAVATGYSQDSDAVVTSSGPAAGSEIAAGGTVVVTTEKPSEQSSAGTTPTDGTATPSATTEAG